jgi:hypothetical protein
MTVPIPSAVESRMTGRRPASFTLPTAQDGPPPDGSFDDRFIEITSVPCGDTPRLLASATRLLLDWWQGRVQAEGRLPSRREFDILDHVRIVPDLFLVEVRSEKLFRMRIQGDNVIAIIGRSNMGRDFCVDAPAGSKERGTAEHFARVVQTRTAWHSWGSASVFDKSYLRVESIDCPLIDPTTGAVTHIVGVLQELENED